MKKKCCMKRESCKKCKYRLNSVSHSREGSYAIARFRGMFKQGILEERSRNVQRIFEECPRNVRGMFKECSRNVQGILKEFFYSVSCD